MRFLVGFYLAATCALVAQDVGGGAPTTGVAQAFVEAWSRNGFNRKVTTPVGNVTKYGSTGLIQTFNSATETNATLALVKPDATETFNVVQVETAMLSYYSSVTVATAGYPTRDTTNCPTLQSADGATNSCQYQTFSNNYVLFVYDRNVVQGTAQLGKTFALRSPFFAKWTALGGIDVLGPAASAETAVTSAYGITASVQTFDQGTLANITSGLLNGRIYGVRPPFYSLYLTNGGPSGTMGFPATEELVIAGGKRQQTFESGAIEYDPATGIVTLRPAVSRVALNPTGSLRLNVGDTVTANAALYAASNEQLTGRTASWITTNSQVVRIQATDLNATLTAVGPGTATVTLRSEGKVSPSLTILVTAICCQIGEGAPTALIQTAFQDAVTRNKIVVKVPADSPATQTGKGYTQLLTDTDSARYLVTVATGSATGYVVSGPILTRYLALGGPAGSLGYPTSDQTVKGRQSFQGGALAGVSAELVSGQILTKWIAAGLETGAYGSPTGPAATFQTFRGTTGSAQMFENAWLLASTAAYAVSGPVLQAYNSNGGPGGDLGAPTGDERAVGAVRQQDFEGGSISYPPGSSTPTVTKLPRTPTITASPNSVLSGSALRLAVLGFRNGATIRISQTGQADFVATVPNGSYTWDTWIPASAASATITIRAVEVNGTATAQGTYAIRNSTTTLASLSIVSGDQQSGAAGGLLSLPLRVLLQDQSGPLAGQTITFAASAGAEVFPATAVTDANGQASATMRLPANVGIALATARALRQVVTFSARSTAISLTDFPTMTQEVDGTLGTNGGTIRQNGALLTAAAAILNYHQVRGELPAPSGPANPIALNEFLKAVCAIDPLGSQFCDGFVRPSGVDVVNLWRVGAFAANNVDVRVERTDLGSIRDLVAAGSPVLLAYTPAAGASHFVVATGIAADGNLTVMNPNPSISLGGATITGAVRLFPGPPASSAFVVASGSPVTISSAAGGCGESFSFRDSSSGMEYFRACDGVSPPYQMDLSGTTFSGVFTSLSPVAARTNLSGASAASLIVRDTQSRDTQPWTLAPLVASMATKGVLNAASFTTDIAPGGLVSIFGTGLKSGSVKVDVNGQDAPVLAAFPFQVNATIPNGIVPGQAAVRVVTASGTATQTITVKDVAPAIFTVGEGQAAITNQDNTLNVFSNPALRGRAIVIYGTGFGTVTVAGGLSSARVRVSAVIGGTEIPAAFAGLTPGFIGLYQANVVLPATLPPGLSLPLFLKQGDAVSNTVTVAVQ